MYERNRCVVLAVALAAAVGAGGCGARGQAGARFVDENPLPQDTMMFQAPEIGTYGGRFVIAQTNGPKTFNAPMANETSSTDITQILYSPLANFDNGSQEVLPAIAKSWDVSPDGLVYTWHLRRGAKFSDGHPITSADILFNFEIAYDPKLHPSIQDLLLVNGKPMEVSAPDSYTVITRLPAPYALTVAAIGSMYILPKHVVEPAYRSGNFASVYGVNTPPESLVTSGAWTLKQYVPQEKTVLTRNPHWFGTDAKGQRLPYLDELVFLIVPDQNTASLKFQSGEVDALDNVKPEDYKSYEENQKQGDYTLHELGPALNTNFMFFNQNKVREAKPGKKVGQPYVDPIKYAWFSNPVFRRAVSKAIDRDAMIKSVFYGDAVKNWSTATPGNKKWNEGATGLDYDPAGAKQLLASLGWKDGNADGVLEDQKGNPISFTIKTNSDNVVRMAMANFVKDDLAKVGIKCTPSGVDFNTLIVNMREDFQYEAGLLGLQSGVPPDPAMGQNVYKSSGLTHYWNIKQPQPETPEEAQIDRLVALNVGTIDEAERHRTWREIQTIVNDQCYFIWLPTLVAKVPVRNKFGNVQPSVIPHRILWNIDRVYSKGPSQRS